MSKWKVNHRLVSGIVCIFPSHLKCLHMIIAPHSSTLRPGPIISETTNECANANVMQPQNPTICFFLLKDNLPPSAYPLSSKNLLMNQFFLSHSAHPGRHQFDSRWKGTIDGGVSVQGRMKLQLVCNICIPCDEFIHSKITLFILFCVT